MITRKELESILGYNLSDLDWEYNCKVFSAIQEKEWEESHPMDE